MFGSANTTPAFGSTAATTPAFGAPSTPSTPFGAPAPTATSAFGSTLFGGGAAAQPAAQPAASGFSFGGGSVAPTPAASAFGAPAAPAFGSAPAAGAFSFGSPAPAAPTSAFGGAASAVASPFGAAPAAPSGGLFGGGAAAPAATTPFGSAPAAQPAAGNIFGATPTPAFGAAPAAPAGGLFGGGAAAAPAGGLFGGAAPAPATSLFGSAPAAQPAAPAFGATAMGNTTGGAGTLRTPYAVTRKPDGNTQINIQAISAMPEYEQKSFEELRFDDYMAGNKGSQGQPQAQPTSQFGFGAAAPAPAAGGFGAAQPTQTFGFGGAAAPAPAAGGLFGGAAPAPAGGLFGGAAPAPAGGLFGGAATPAPAFGAPAPASTFGSTGFAPKPAAAPAAGGFGFGSPAPAAPAAGGFGFGAPAAAKSPATGLFGAPAPAAGGLFGAAAPAPATGGLFGTPAPAPAGGLFGAPATAPATGLFGAPAAAAPASGGLFGAPAAAAPAAGGLFGAAPVPAAGGLFGAPAPAPAGGLFGATPAPATGGLFGARAPATPVQYGGVAAAPPAAPSEDALLAQKLAAIDAQKQELILLEQWRGTPPNGSRGNVIPSSLSERDAAAYAAGAGGLSSSSPNIGSYAAASSASLRSYQVNPKSTARIRPRGFGRALEPSYIGDSRSGNSPVLSPQSYLGSSTKRLVIKPGSLSKPKIRLQLNGQKEGINGELGPSASLQNNSTSPAFESPRADGNKIYPENGSLMGSNRNAINAGGDNDSNDQFSPTIARLPTDVGRINVGPENGDTGFSSPPSAKSPGKVATPSTSPGGRSYELYRQVVASPEEASPSKNAEEPQAQTASPSLVPNLTKPRYIMSPSHEELSSMSEADLAAVSNFSVSRTGYGSIEWEGAVDVRSVDIDTVVSIEDKEVAVYDDYEANNTKPDVGSKLNRPAIITLLHVFPKEGQNATEEAIKKFQRKITRQTAKMGADLISYDSREGVWVFRTHHFSRYALDDDDSDDEEEVEPQSHMESAKMLTIRNEESPAGKLALLPGYQQPDFELGERGGRSPGYQMDTLNTNNDIERRHMGGTRLGVPLSEDETSESTYDGRDMIHTDDDDDDEMFGTRNVSLGGESHVLEAAEAAYGAMMMETGMNDDYSRLPNTMELQVEALALQEKQSVDEDTSAEKSVSEYLLPSPVAPSSGDVNNFSRLESGICARIASACGISSFSSSRTDYGRMMGRSFGVGWRRDGSFCHAGLVKAEIKSKPPIRISSRSRPSHSHESVRRVVIQRPAFKDGIDGSTSDASHPDTLRALLLPMLKVHMQHSVKSCVVEDVPLYALPKGLGRKGGSNSSYKALCMSLDDYANAASHASLSTGSKCDGVGMVVSHAFTLLSAMYGQESDVFDNEEENNLVAVDDTIAANEHISSTDFNLKQSWEDRRREGLLAWLRETVLDDVNHDILAAQKRGDYAGAILSAMSGGDLPRACSIASEHGFFRLTTLLSSGFASGDDIADQMEQWYDSGFSAHISPFLARVYSLLAEDLGVEEGLFKNSGISGIKTLDWKRRLGLHLWYTHSSLTSAIHAYEEGIASGVAPQPYPQYVSLGVSSASDSTDHPQCLLYRLLRLRAGGGGRDGDPGASLAKIVAPDGYTASQNDFSASFHIASAIQGLGCSPALTSIEWATLLNSYVAQLVSAGMWEWAVYVLLCTNLEADTTDKTEMLRREQAVRMAKDIVLQNFTSNCIDKRTFLEKEVGIPSAWFEESLAQRSGYDGDPLSHVKHLVRCAKLEEAANAVEQLVIPNPLFSGGEAAQRLKQFLEVMRSDGLQDAMIWGENNGCEVTLDLLNLTDEVSLLSKLSKRELSDHMESVGKLSAFADEMLGRIVDCDDFMARKSEYVSCAKSVKSIKPAVGVVEAASVLSLLRLQLGVLRSGLPICEETRREENVMSAAQLGFSGCKGEGFSSSIPHKISLDVVELGSLRGVADGVASA